MELCNDGGKGKEKEVRKIVNLITESHIKSQRKAKSD